jgi:hypothetical protein
MNEEICHLWYGFRLFSGIEVFLGLRMPTPYFSLFSLRDILYGRAKRQDKKVLAFSFQSHPYSKKGYTQLPYRIFHNILFCSDIFV